VKKGARGRGGEEANKKRLAITKSEAVSQTEESEPLEVPRGRDGDLGKEGIDDTKCLPYSTEEGRKWWRQGKTEQRCGRGKT